MKLTRTFIGLSSALVAMVVMLAVGRFTAWARENVPILRIENTPINRDPKLGSSFSPVVKKAAPSVVNIFTTRFVKERLMRNPMMNDPIFRQFFGDQDAGDGRERTRKEQSLGSGVIVSPDGYILTANHVVADADEIKVAIAGNKSEFTARVIGKDKATDVAVLKIEANNLPAVTLADSDQMEVGDVVLAIGNPFGLGQTVTKGIVSALGRSGLPGFNQYQDFIQTDAAINPGNSGGALVDAEGRLVGINTAIISPSGGNNGIGLAVPINLARGVLERLISGGKVTRGYLGILPQDVDAGLAAQFNLPDQNGALIGDVVPNAPAAKAGLKSGDVILSINGKDIPDAHGLQLTVSQCAPGSSATIKFVRNGLNKTVVVPLGELPGGNGPANDEPNTPDTSTAKIDALDGVTVADLEPEVRAQLRVPPGVQGALVSDVDGDSNSAEAGLRPNDLIVEINRQSVTNSEDAVRLGQAARGEQILVKVWRRLGDFAGTRYLSVDNLKKK
jgi:serine protease Do